MSEVPSAPRPAQMAVRLRIPAAAPFRAIGSALAGKFAEIAGCGREDVRSLGPALDRAAADVIALEGASDADSLDIELNTGDGRVRVTIACGQHHAQVTRPLSR